MNIFYLSHDPRAAAKCHADKHAVKMILESAQLLSTAHRVLDGTRTFDLSVSGRNVARWVLPDYRDELLYKATHVNHPSAIWVRQSVRHYNWLENLFVELCKEYTYRYGRIHLCEAKLVDVLALPPDNIDDLPFQEPPQAMPDHCKVPGNSVQAYRNYYMTEKRDIAEWRYTEKPEWYV